MRLDAKFVESVRVYIDIYIHTYTFNKFSIQSHRCSLWYYSRHLTINEWHLLRSCLRNPKLYFGYRIMLLLSQEQGTKDIKQKEKGQYALIHTPFYCNRIWYCDSITIEWKAQQLLHEWQFSFPPDFDMTGSGTRSAYHFKPKCRSTFSSVSSTVLWGVLSIQ